MLIPYRPEENVALLRDAEAIQAGDPAADDRTLDLLAEKKDDGERHARTRSGDEVGGHRHDHDGGDDGEIQHGFALPQQQQAAPVNHPHPHDQQYAGDQEEDIRRAAVARVFLGCRRLFEWVGRHGYAYW